MSFKVTLTIFLVAVQLISISEQACSIFEYGVSEKDKKAIVDLHNSLRNKIRWGQVPGQPRGINLKTIKWDNCLARGAQNVANKCEFKHDIQKCPQWKWVGQNLFKSMTTSSAKGSNWKTVIEGWFSEYKRYKFGTQSSGAGHYTQIVWADTDRIGCGYTFYKGKGKWPYEKIYFCNYGPGGNYEGQKPYKTI